ncbi:SOS response-associated peptidase [Paenibacillus thermotolerans]|uniref:SOS response-associated peptidase n=1 Tax=Paenibacillus thermotolerans TaxID=3027807 RepID=UPI00236764F3|nr:MULTISPECIES: SOS response-associated peptidase [unclassified Paenibacillus]
MCGRFTLTAEWGLVRDWFYIEFMEQMEKIAPRYNAAPGQHILAVLAHEGKRRAGFLKWGLPSPAAAKRSTPLINARAETLAQRPTFRTLVARKRCIIPADGFYEWKVSDGNKKQPLRITLRDRPLFSFAALYDTYQSEDGARHHSCVIVTTASNRFMSPIHERMPAILRREDEELWLDRSVTDADRLLPLLSRQPSEEMQAYPVSTSIGNVRWDEPECIAPAGDTAGFTG